MKPPHAKKVKADFQDFLFGLRTALNAFLVEAEADGAKYAIYRSCTAGHTVLSAYGRDSEVLRAAGGCSRRIAMLAVTRQYSLARVELRRLIECVVWHVYFCDHPVEWAEFKEHPGKGWGNHDQDPIASAASAEISMFFRYARERLKRDPSGLGCSAASSLHVQYGSLSGDVHAAMGAVHPSGSLALAFDPHEDAIIEALSTRIRQITSDALMVVCAVNPKILNHLDAIDRSWFDWVVGPERAKVVRGAPFGVDRSH